MPTKSGKHANWVKNFGNSVKFSAVDILKDIAPNTYDTTSNAQESVTNIVKEIRDLRSGQNRMMDAINGTPALKYAVQGAKNAVSDLKSGRINNQDRINKMAEDDMNDFSLDDGSFDFSPSDDVSAGESGLDLSPIAAMQPAINATANATRETAIATQQLGSSINKQTKVIATSFDASIALSKQVATTSFAMNQMMHEQNMGALNAVNSNLASMIDFNNDTVSKLTMGSLKYYDDSLSVMNNILGELQKSNRHIVDKPEQEEEEKPQYRQVFSGRGVMKFNKYPDMLKKNFLKAVDEDPILSTAKEFLTDEDALKMLAANPLGGMSTFIAGALIPTTMKKFMTQLDETIGSFFPALFMKFNRGKSSDNPLMNLLSKVFGIDTTYSSTPNFASYEKGAVPWSGVSDTTLNKVIPKYLAGILAAVSGKEERTFDAVRGDFTTTRELKKQYEDERTSQLVGPFSKIMREMSKTIEDAITFRSEEERKDMAKDMERMFKGIAESGQGYHPDKDDLTSLGVENRSNAKVLKAAFKTMSRGKQLSTGMSTLKAQGNLKEYFNEAITNDPALSINLLNAFGSMPFDEHITRNDYDPARYKVKKGSAGFGSVDEFGNSQNDLLRDIKEILLEGISVYPVSHAGGPIRGGMSGGPNANMSKRLGKYKANKATKTNDIYDEETAGQPSIISSQQKEEEAKKGKMYSGDVDRMDTDQIMAHLSMVQASKNADVKKGEMGGLYGAIDKYINANTFSEKVVSIKDSIAKFFKSPVKLFTTAIDKIDSALYTIIYGDEKGNSIVSVAISSIKNTFNQFTGWLKKKYNSASKFMFGEGGVKDTRMYKWAKDKGNQMMDYIFGKKEGGADGSRKGGVLSSSFNALGDIFKQTRASMFGTPYTDSEGKQHAFNKNSVFNEVKIGVLRGFKHMRTYLFGEPKLDKAGKKMSFADQMYDTLGEGYNNFKNFFFGTKTSKEDGQKQFKEVMTDFKAKMPKSLAYGMIGAGVGLFTNFGVLGSLFLPGGPVGGAIVGTAIGMLSQTEKFKSFLFGPKGADGSRMGGVVSKKVIGWFSANKTAILGGGMFGAVKGLINSTGLLQSMGPLGYMTSMFLPGGPVGGAIMGAAIGIGIKSKTFQKLLYGKDDGTGTKKGGLLNRSYSQAMKKHLPNMAFGALSFGVGGAVLGQMGIMGAMLTPAGPIGAAIMGAATGIAISSQKFRKYLFGEKDEKTGFHKAGLFDKLSNIFKLSIVEPFKLKLEKISWGIEKWFTKSIANPFKDAMAPLKVQFKVLTDNIKSMFVEGWKSMTNYIGDVFTKYVGMPFGKFMEERVMKPMRNFLGTLVNGIGKVFGTILASPIKALSIIASSFQASQEKKGVKAGKEERANNLKMSLANVINGQKNGEGMGVFANAKRVAMGYISKDVKEKDKSRYAWYRVSEMKRKKARDEEQSKYFAEGDAKIKDKDSALKDRRRAAKDINFDTSFKDKDGNLQDASPLYGMSNNIEDVANGIDESNSILTKIKNIISNIGAAMTGNRNYTKENAGSDTKVKDDPKPKPPFGRPSGMSGKKKTDGKSTWHDFDFDMQMFGTDTAPKTSLFKKMKARIPGLKNNVQKVPETKTYDATMSKQERSFEKKTRTTGGDAGLKYLRIIASNVDGQLNGVGSNVYKMRKAIESLTGTDSGDEGSSNKDRVSFLGKAGRMAKMMIFHPVEFIGGMIMKPFKFVTNILGKILNTGKTIVNGVLNTVDIVTKGVVGLGKKVGKVVMAVPKMMVSIVKGVGEAAKELVVGGIKALSHGVVGLIDTTFKVLSGAGEALGHILEGGSKAVKYLAEGVGLLSKELLKGIGQFAGLAVDLTMDAARTLVDVGGSIAKAIGGVAASIVGSIGTMATTLVGGVTEMITTASGALFSIITSPFKWVGGLLNKIMPTMNKVVVTGGTLDVIKKIEVVEKLKSSDGIDSLISTVSGSSAAAATGKLGHGKRSRMKNRLSKAAGIDLQLFSNGTKTEEAGQPASSNVNAEMLESGLANSKGGIVKRTASFMNAVKQNLADKLFSRTNGTKQTSLLGKLLDVTTKHTGAFGKFVKWIMIAGAALLSLLKNLKLPSILGGKALGGVLKDAMEKALTKTEDLGKDVARGAKNKFAKGMESLKSRFKNSDIYKKGSSFVRENMPNVFKDSAGVAEDAAKATSDAIMTPGQRATAFADAGTTVAEDVSKEVPGTIAKAQSKAGADAGEGIMKDLETKEAPKWMKAFKDALGIVEAKMSSVTGTGLKFADALYGIAEKNLTGTILAKYAGKLAKGAAQIAGAAATVGALDVALGVWNTATGIADAANIFKVNPEAVTVPMRICAAITKVVFGNSIPAIVIIDIIFSILGDIMGFDHIQYFATQLYSIISDSDSIAKLEAEQAKFAKAAADAGMTVKDYNSKVNESTFDKMTDTFQSAKDSVSGFLFGKNDANGNYQNGVFANIKDGVGSGMAGLFGQNDANGNYQPGMFSQASSGISNNLAYLFGQNNADTGKFEDGAMKKGVDNNLAYLFGQNNAETGKFEDGAMKKGLDNNLAWLFGQNDENGDFKKGVIQKFNDRIDNELDYLFGKIDPNTGEKGEGIIKKGFDNNVAYLCGQNDENGKYQGGVFSRLYTSINDKIDNTLAWLFGQSGGGQGTGDDGEYADNRGVIKQGIDNNLAWLFGQNDGTGKYQGGIFSRAYDGIKDGIDTHVIQPLSNAWAAVESSAEEIKNNFLGFANNSSQIIKDKGVLVGTMDIAANIFRGMLGMEWSNDPIQAAMDGLISGVSSAFNGISDTFSSLVKAFQNFDPIGYVKEFFQKFMDNLLPDSVKERLNIAAQSVSDMSTDDDKAKGLVVSYTGGRLHDAGAWISNHLFGGSGKGDSHIPTNQFIGSGEGEPTEQNGFSYYSQEDPKWKDKSYGIANGMGNFGDTGCAPTAMAMVATDLTGTEVTPDTMANYSLAKGYRVPGGTSENFFSDAGTDLGLQTSSVSGKDDMVSQLAQGNPVVLGGRSSDNGPFTEAGHYSVAVGLSDDGTKAIMNDPRGPQYSKAVDLNTLSNDTVTGYSFSNGFSGSGKRKFRGKGGSRKRPTFKGAGTLTGDDILAAGEQQLGLDYQLGGNGSSSTDCGKFTQDTFDKCGCDLTTRTADGQYKFFEDHGGLIDPSAAKPGDLLFFSSDDNGYAGVGHVGIYAGNNYTLNAATSTGVAYADMSRYWGDHLVGAGSVSKVFGIEPGVGKGPGSIPSAGSKNNKGGSAKPKTLLDLMGHIGQMYSNFSSSVIGGKVYTGTAWDSDGNGSQSSGRSAGSIGGGNVDRKTVYNFLKDQGYNDVAIAGIMGNIEQEHHFSTSDVGLDSSSGQEVGGLGLFQWTHERADAMREFAASTGRDPEDAGAQLDYLMQEIKNSYHSVDPNTMNNFDSPEAAAAHFNSDFEGGTMGDRQVFANEFYQQFQNGTFTGGGIGDSAWKSARMANIYRLIHGGRMPQKVKARYAKQVPKTNSYAQAGAIPNAPQANSVPKVVTTPPNSSDTEGKTPSSPIADNTATVGDVTQSSVDTFTGGEYFNDASKITKEAKAFVKGSGTIADVAKSIGITNPTPDTPLGAKQQWMLGFREYSPVRTWDHYLTESQLWKEGSGQTSLESWMENHDFTGGGIGDIFKQRLAMYGFMSSHRMDSSRLRRTGGVADIQKMMARSNAVQARQAAKANGTVPGAVAAPAKTATTPAIPDGIVQADISTFTGGEYYNDPTKVTQAAKDYAAGKGTLADVAKSVGLSGAPTDDTPLNVAQQQMLGFREYSPVRTWAHYKVESQLWKNDGKTSVEQWMEGKAPIIQPTTDAAKAIANFTGATVPPPVTKVDKQVSSVDATSLVRNYNASVNGNGSSTGSDNDIMQKVVDLLNTIANNTGGINDGIGKIAGSNLIVDNGKGGQKIIAVNANGGNTATNQLLDPNGGKPTSPEYDYNRKIAAGGSFAQA